MTNISKVYNSLHLKYDTMTDGLEKVKDGVATVIKGHEKRMPIEGNQEIMEEALISIKAK